MSRRTANRLALLAAVALVVLVVLAVSRALDSVAAAHPGAAACSPECVERVKARERAELRARHRRALVREMRRYKAHPMPACTWQDESGDASVPPFALSRYRALNTAGANPSYAGGKFQFIPSTWRNIGGTRYAPLAHQARPIYQERMARKLAREGIAIHWVNC